MDNSSMKHGAFGWFELMTTDVEGAKSFYKKLFNWEYEDIPMTDGGNYTMAKVNGTAVAGIMAQPDECKGMKPCWDIYITVDDVDATAAAVTQNGGKVLRPASDIPEVGRFCVLQDPQGAVIMAITYAEK